ncbi:50S ribosomal protein L21e [Candidatus Woesearchaeota archaeon]|nr:50S ribosomal protein L21e [Candidatus Woesearchaeota archaeon]
MAQRIGGQRRKTRHKLQKKTRQKGKISITKYFQEFSKGDKVLLAAEPAVHTGMYNPRFHSKVGIIKSKRGNCYNIQIKDGGKEKTLIVHPVHLRRI